MTASTFHLSAPSQFRGLHPDLPIRVYQRHLPHWRQEGATYAVTFRLADSIPQTQMRALRQWRETWERLHPEPRSEQEWHQLAREITSRTERWMDEGYGSCVLGKRHFADLMLQSLLHFQNKRHFTSCFVVMPNHVHMVMKPLKGFELEDCLQSIKQFVSRRVNAALGTAGTSSLWAEESYDRIVRDEEHLWQIVQYIGRNPAKAGLPADQWFRWIDPSWQATGWRFEDA